MLPKSSTLSTSRLSRSLSCRIVSRYRERTRGSTSSIELQRFGEHANRRQRRFQLVGHAGDKLGPHLREAADRAATSRHNRYPARSVNVSASINPDARNVWRERTGRCLLRRQHTTRKPGRSSRQRFASALRSPSPGAVVSRRCSGCARSSRARTTTTEPVGASRVRDSRSRARRDHHGSPTEGFRG